MMKQFLTRCFVAIITLSIVSCAQHDEQQPKIRIVDLDGKAHSVVTRMPELNKKAIVSQGVMNEQTAVFENNLPNNLPPQQNLVAKNDEVQTTPDYGVLAQEQTNQQQPVTQTESISGAGKQVAPTIEYDLSSPEEDVKLSKAEKKSSKTPVVSSDSQNGLFVQVGAFSNEESAAEVLAKMKKFHKGHIEVVDGKVKLHRVLLGPFKSKNQALALVKKIKAAGHDAVLMRNK